MSEDAREFKDASENLNTRKSAAKKILTGIWLKNFENYERKPKFMPWIFHCVEFSIDNQFDKSVKNQRLWG